MRPQNNQTSQKYNSGTAQYSNMSNNIPHASLNRNTEMRTKSSSQSKGNSNSGRRSIKQIQRTQQVESMDMQTDQKQQQNQITGMSMNQQAKSQINLQPNSSSINNINSIVAKFESINVSKSQRNGTIQQSLNPNLSPQKYITLSQTQIMQGQSLKSSTQHLNKTLQYPQTAQLGRITGNQQTFQSTRTNQINSQSTNQIQNQEDFSNLQKHIQDKIETKNRLLQQQSKNVTEAQKRIAKIIREGQPDQNQQSEESQKQLGNKSRNNGIAVSKSENIVGGYASVQTKSSSNLTSQSVLNASSSPKTILQNTQKEMIKTNSNANYQTANNLRQVQSGSNEISGVNRVRASSGMRNKPSQGQSRDSQSMPAQQRISPVRKPLASVKSQNALVTYRGFIMTAQQQQEYMKMEQEQIDRFISSYHSAKFACKKNGVVASYSANTHQGIVRNYNEDRVSIILNIIKPKFKNVDEWPRCSFFAVYDGHGGSACADYLRDQLHQLIVRDDNFPNNPKIAIENGIAEAERIFLEWAHLQSKPEEDFIERSGTCAIIVLIVGDMCYVANVGDSRAIMSVDSGEKILLLSKDHKPEDEFETKRVEENGGQIYQNKSYVPDPSPDNASGVQMIIGPHRVFPGRLSVSRTIGDIEAKDIRYGGNPKCVIATPDIKCFKIRANYDFIILGCDGVFEKQDNKQIINAAWDASRCNWQEDEVIKRNIDSKYINTQGPVSIHQKAGLVVDKILHECVFAKTLDNITAVMIAFQNFENMSGEGVNDSFNHQEFSQVMAQRRSLEPVQEEFIESELDTPMAFPERKGLNAKWDLSVNQGPQPSQNEQPHGQLATPNNFNNQSGQRIPSASRTSNKNNDQQFRTLQNDLKSELTNQNEHQMPKSAGTQSSVLMTLTKKNGLGTPVRGQSGSGGRNIISQQSIQNVKKPSQGQTPKSRNSGQAYSSTQQIQTLNSNQFKPQPRVKSSRQSQKDSMPSSDNERAITPKQKLYQSINVSKDKAKISTSQLNLTMNQRASGMNLATLNADYLVKSNNIGKLHTQQMGGISSLAQSSKLIPKKDLRESNQNFNTTQGIKSATSLVSFIGNKFDKTVNLANIGSLSKPPTNMGTEGRYKKKSTNAD